MGAWTKASTDRCDGAAARGVGGGSGWAGRQADREQMGRWVDGQMDGWMDGWIDGGTDEGNDILVAAQLGVVLSEDECRSLFTSVDADGSGALEFLEFFNVVSKHKTELDVRVKSLSGQIQYFFRKAQRRWRRRKLKLPPAPKKMSQRANQARWIIRCTHTTRIA